MPRTSGNAGPDAAAEPRYRDVKGLKRATEIMHMLAERPMRASEITKVLGTPWATIYRTVSRLTDDGLLQKDPSGEYRIGPMLWMLASAYVRDHPVLTVALPHLEALLPQVHGMLKLCERIDGYAVTLFAQQNTQGEMIRRYRDPYRLPLHCASFGHVFLAHAAPEFVDEYLSHPLARLTARTITDPEMLRDRLDEVRESGYAVTEEDVQMLVGSVGAPAFDREGKVVAAVAAIMSLSAMHSPGLLERHVSLVTGIATTVSESIGWGPSTISAPPLR